MPSSFSALLLQSAYHLLASIQPRRRSQYSISPDARPFIGGRIDGDVEACVLQLIPAHIWTYWDSDKSDTLVEQCVANWRRHNPGFEVHVINSQNIGSHIPEEDMPPGFAALHPTKRSDWIRLYVVSRHGGYWLDASILLTSPVHWLEDRRRSQKSEFVGFYLDGYTQDADFPVVESWAFGAPANSPFVIAWQREFHCALIEMGTESYLTALREREDSAVLLQGIADPAYLLIHVTAQQVLRRMNGFRLALLKAEDTAYFYQKALSWKWYLLYARLCLVQAEPQPAPLIKLRGGERRHFAKLFEQEGGPANGSIWQLACDSLSSDVNGPTSANTENSPHTIVAENGLQQG